MPEQITKYPDVTMQVLEGAGARCGEGLPQEILTECPEERFCVLPTGEMCIYGVEDIPRMTQITEAEVAEVVCPGGEAAAGNTFSAVEGLMMAGALFIGFAAGSLSRKLSSGS